MYVERTVYIKVNGLVVHTSRKYLRYLIFGRPLILTYSQIGWYCNLTRVMYEAIWAKYTFESLFGHVSCTHVNFGVRDALCTHTHTHTGISGLNLSSGFCVSSMQRKCMQANAHK